MNAADCVPQTDLVETGRSISGVVIGSRLLALLEMA